MEEKRKYDCGRCTNRNTPICGVCNYAKSPSGRISRPTMYTESVRISACRCAAYAAFLRENHNITDYIADAVTRGASIPVGAVLRYNKLLEIEKKKAERR